MAEILLIIKEGLKVLILVLGEIFAAKKRDRLADEKYEKNLEASLKLIREAAVRIRTRARRESSEANDLEDRREEDRKKITEGKS